ncbi:hypothetical protein N658DRAFT_505134 [Parathielavia hyrcaniae]|uniref:Uncharacterized protein n=1 Tax=Parathielavia hyrcaniae TaxID=113614 RepID=A0AAN6Q4I1_9PEZI|nr:hypothetical protein N658DRAFT_505134 [Parathielavia hyrcaniae]
MRLAVHRGQTSTIRVMLRRSQHPIEPWFRYYYLKEAYTLLKPATLACLLEHPSMRFDEADLTDEADLPLAHLVRNADRLCAETYDKRNDIFSGKRGPWSRMENIAPWIACVAAFAQAGADPEMRDKAGRSALDYLGEHLAYDGKDRFKKSLASALRAVVGGEEQNDAPLDPVACWEAIKALKVPGIELPRVSGGSDEFEEGEEGGG